MYQNNAGALVTLDLLGFLKNAYNKHGIFYEIVNSTVKIAKETLKEFGVKVLTSARDVLANS